MNYDAIVPEGDLPPSHPLVLEALKGIISGPISELRNTVDKNISQETTQAGLRVGKIDYNNILPNINNTGGVEASNNNFPIREYSQAANNVLETLASSAKIDHVHKKTEDNIHICNQIVEEDPDQMQLPLFKQTEMSDLFSKMFDLERKLDVIIKYVKPNKN